VRFKVFNGTCRPTSLAKRRKSSPNRSLFWQIRDRQTIVGHRVAADYSPKTVTTISRCRGLTSHSR
jgi:hypothetical protein